MTSHANFQYPVTLYTALFALAELVTTSHGSTPIPLARRQQLATDNNLINVLAGSAATDVTSPNPSATGVASGVIVPILPTCEETNPVLSCSLTEQEWQQFDIDGFVAEYIAEFGPEPNFPFVFAITHTENGVQGAFDCGDLFAQGDQCGHPEFSVSGLGNDCRFDALVSQGSTVCDKYTDPKAGFVTENWLRLRRDLQNQAFAYSDARDALRGENFIQIITDGLAEKKGSIFDVVIGFLLSIPLTLITRPIRPVIKALKKVDELDVIFGVFVDPKDVFQTVQANNAIDDGKERMKDLLNQQLDAMVVAEQTRAQQILDAIFKNPGQAGQVSLDAARASSQFKATMSGAFLGPSPSREEIAEDTKSFLQNFLISSVIKASEYSLLLDPTELDDGIAAGGTFGTVCQQGFKGFIGLGAPCAHFRREERFDGPEPNDATVIQQFINVKNMKANAEECGGGSMDGSDGAGDLPRCMYDFKIINLN